MGAAAAGSALLTSETAYVGENHCLDSVAEAELGQDACDVGLDRGLAEVQLGADLGIGQALGDGRP